MAESLWLRMGRARAGHPGRDGVTGLIAVHQGACVRGPDVAAGGLLRTLGVRIPDEVDRPVDGGADPSGRPPGPGRAVLLDELVPMLAAADADPATPVPAE